MKVLGIESSCDEIGSRPASMQIVYHDFLLCKKSH